MTGQGHLRPTLGHGQGREEARELRRERLVSTVRLLAGAAVLVVVAVHVGARPFVDAVQAVDPRALGLAVVVTSVTTLCCARRWQLVSAALGGQPPPLGAAVAAYYRSQLVNATLPGGMLGDVDRGVRHRLGGGIRTGLRAVVWERSAGMLVQVVVALLIVLVWLAPSTWPVLVVAAGLVLLLRPGVREICVLSLVAMAGHVLLFAVAARAVGVHVPTITLVPVALVVLLVSVLPTNIAGWGPREGASAWAFASVGSTAGAGVTISVVYGVMALVAVLPGLLVLVSAGRSRAWVTAPTRC